MFYLCIFFSQQFFDTNINLIVKIINNAKVLQLTWYLTLVYFSNLSSVKSLTSVGQLKLCSSPNFEFLIFDMCDQYSIVHHHFLHLVKNFQIFNLKIQSLRRKLNNYCGISSTGQNIDLRNLTSKQNLLNGSLCSSVSSIKSIGEP